jgi:phenylalanyl-tRNA synthetase alpha chain
MAKEKISGKDVVEKLEQLDRSGTSAIENATTKTQLEEARNEYLGRKGELSSVMKLLGRIEADMRPVVGQKANELRNKLEAMLAQKKESGIAKTTPKFDLTLPGRRFTVNTEHPFHKTMHEIVDIFVSMGFEIKDGPDVETNFNNYDALNTPKDHPARTEEDTFYLEIDDLLLRTHTSPVQIRTMQNEKPPIRIISPGRCYRRDTVDATHYFAFNQVEGLYIDRNVSMANLKGTLTAFAKTVMGPQTKIRFRPHFFPFTEPSVEYDFSCPCGGKDSECRMCKGSGWIEISGAGMVDPNVLRNVGLDPDEWQGYAWGMGVERIVMIKYNITDIRLLYMNDLRMLDQFR